MIYLDNAATTFPKPRRVNDEAARCMRVYCGNPGRGAHALSVAAAEKIYECRELLSDFFGLRMPENVIFTMNTTYALNMAVKGVLRGGDHILISDMEHNSVFRPVAKLQDEGRIQYDVFPTFTGQPHTDEDICDGIIKLLTPRTRAVVCAHIPNICPSVLPIAKIGRLCRERGIIFIVDAAQSAGHVPINMNEMNIDILCAPGHKGLYGPQGCGIMLLGPGVSVGTLTEGGNGINSLEALMPDFSPEKYESGTLPTPSIAGLCEGVREISRLGAENIRQLEASLHERAEEQLSAIPDIKIYTPGERGAVLLFSSESRPADYISSELNSRGIFVRGGYHCAALGHATLKTPPGGAVRASFGIFNRPSDIDALTRAVAEII